VNAEFFAGAAPLTMKLAPRSVWNTANVGGLTQSCAQANLGTRRGARSASNAARDRNSPIKARCRCFGDGICAHTCPYRKPKTADRDRESADTRSDERSLQVDLVRDASGFEHLRLLEVE
jgi:hypothetical protein